jgi:hypothetical protein
MTLVFYSTQPMLRVGLDMALSFFLVVSTRLFYATRSCMGTARLWSVVLARNTYYEDDDNGKTGMRDKITTPDDTCKVIRILTQSCPRPPIRDTVPKSRLARAPVRYDYLRDKINAHLFIVLLVKTSSLREL